MKAIRSVLLAVVVVLPAVLSCADPRKLAADEEKRKDLIEALVTNPSSRQEVIDRLIGPPNDRQAVIERILQNEEAIGHLVQKIMTEDRGKAIVASKIAADSAVAKTFIRMLMLTGVMGESMTQKQADALGLGEPFAYGNQKRTMVDMKRVAGVIESTAKNREGRFPICSQFATALTCLGKKLPADTLAALQMKDAWGNPLLYRTDPEGTQYVLVSFASDGADDGLGKVGPTDSYNCDIVFSNGDFIQWPGWIRKSDIR
ncbi:MAG: hypothetical protein ACRD5D_04405 [Candidatus Polarisedimenticolia bacterium]